MLIFINPMRKAEFQTGDLIAIIGGSVGKDGKFADTASIANVLQVGKSDLMVSLLESQAFGAKPRILTVPKGLCQKLKISPEKLEKEKILTPQVGDLVLSFTRSSYGQEEDKKITGVIYSIKHSLGKPSSAVLMSGTDFVEVKFSSLLVLSRD